MLTILSPSKSVMQQEQPTHIPVADPLFPAATQLLVEKLQALNQTELTKTLNVSDALGKLNFERFQSWDNTAKRAALWMYSGDVYNGVDAYTMTNQQIDFAQDSLLIVSGLYGLLRPCDLVQPYRLEMRIPFAADGHKNLYDYWQKDAAAHLQQLQPETILLCASKEYAKLITKNAPKHVHIITPRFMQDTGKGLREKGLFAKYARGKMARWVVDNQITAPQDLKNYTIDDLTYSSDLSSDTEYVYIIPQDFSLKGRFTKK